MGKSNSLKVFQKTKDEMTGGLEAVVNIPDDITVHGTTDEECDQICPI